MSRTCSGVNHHSVRRWNAAFRTQGQAALTAKPTAGRPPRLTPRAVKSLTKTLVRGARAAGYPTDLWTCRRVRHFIQTRFAVTYDISGVWRLLRALGLSPQKPERRAVERDDAVIRRWVRQAWPRIKKSRAAEGRLGLPVSCFFDRETKMR